MYLLPETVRQLFHQCAAVSGGGSRIAFSYIPTGSDGRPDVGRWTGLLLWLQNAAGEPLHWSKRPEDLGEFLAETGWKIVPDSAGKYGIEYFIVATK